MEIGLRHIVFALALAVVSTSVLYLAFGTDPIAERCGPDHTELAGVCVSLKEECESRSGNYYYDQSRHRCFATD